MRLTYSVTKECQIEVETKDIKQTFQFLSYADSVFKHKSCGNCDSTNLIFQHRQPKGYDYYSVKCLDCKHELKFGQQKEGGKLFPKGWEPPYEGDGDGRGRKTKQRHDDGGDSYDNEYAGAGVDSDDVAF